MILVKTEGIVVSVPTRGRGALPARTVEWPRWSPNRAASTTRLSSMSEAPRGRRPAGPVGAERRGPTGPAPKAISWIAGALACATAIGIVALWPSGGGLGLDDDIGLVSEVYDGTVTGVTRGPCAGTPADAGADCSTVSVRLDQGPDEGRERVIELADSPTTPELTEGDEIVLAYNPDAEPGFEYQYADRQRRPVLLGLALLFAAAVVALGRWRGIAALAALGFAIVVLLVFVLPAILDGTSPVLVAVVGSSAIAFLALYLTIGFRPMTTVALLGTLASLACTVALAAVFTELAQLSGAVSDEAALVALGTAQISLSDLVLAGMVIGALGALDDVTVTQASAVWELRAAEPTMNRSGMFRAGLRIGRDHVSSAVNTLVLAYAGAALPLLLLFTETGQSLGAVANSEVVAAEIVRALVGSIGLVLAVPFTTALASWVVASVPADETGTSGRRAAYAHDD